MQIALQNLSALISLEPSCERMDEILSHEEQTGAETLTNKGYDIVFDHVALLPMTVASRCSPMSASQQSRGR